MVFSSMTFLTLFLPAVLLLYFCRQSMAWKNGVLLTASLLFYAWGEPVGILLMLLSVAVNFFCALGIERGIGGVKKMWLILGVSASVIFLLYFKYAAFFVNTAAAWFSLPYQIAEKRLPIGISFYTFQILTYTVDVYRGKAKAQKNPALLLLYVSCFPQLIAGPIVQYADVAVQIDSRYSTPSCFAEGARRFVIGLSKKVLLANICGSAVEALYITDPQQTLSVLGAWYAAVLYTLQIYFDFSAYSDMAIGLGKIFGFTYKENFRYPYLSGSVAEFWRRWHISLGSFFRDYVYIPMGGSRCTKLRAMFNIMVVWTLTGLWHGACWNFILWGMYYGILIVSERFLLGTKRVEKIPLALRVLFVMVITVVGFTIFYHTDLTFLARHLMAMTGLKIVDGQITFAALHDPLAMAVVRKYTIFPLIAAAACFPIVPAVQKRLGETQWCQKLSYACATILLILSALFLVGQTYNPFIYFRF